MFVTTYRQDLELIESAKMLDMLNLPFIFSNHIKAKSIAQRGRQTYSLCQIYMSVV